MTVALKVMTAPRLTIGFFSDSYLPRISGVVHSIEAYAHALRQQGHRVVIVAPYCRSYEDADPDVIRYPSLRSGSPFPLAIPFSPSASRRVHGVRPDVIHAHSPFLMGGVAALLARTLHVPLVFTHHTLYDQYVHYIPWIGSSLTRPTVRAYVAAYANRCNCVIAPSPTIAARLRADGVHARIEALPTAVVDPRMFSSLHPNWVRAKFGVPHDRPLVITVSRLGKEKSVGLVLEGFALLRRRAPAHLLIVGGGPEEAALREQASQLGVAETVHFAGLLPHQQTLECMAAADVFVFASQTETQGLVITEAMAIGVPVVAVGAGGVADTVRDGETGMLVPPRADALADRALQLIENISLRQQLRSRAQTAVSEFSPEVLSHRLIALYESVLPVGTMSTHPAS